MQNPSIDQMILERVESLAPITLPEMKCIKLMNRTDTKFVTSKEVLLRLLEMAEGHYYAQHIGENCISKYRTIYWDTDDYVFFTQHQCGKAPRQKVRVRTYMDSLETFLEIKTKNNKKRTKKKRISVPAPDALGQEGADFVLERTKIGLDTMHPALQNRFERITLVNYGKTERLTIDFNVSFLNFDTKGESGTGDLVIIELKRDGNVPSPVLDILRVLRIEPSGFSKYCIGTVLTNKTIRQNNFKPKVRNVGRLIRKGNGVWV
ncbi:MAG: polyphosphate polymerase domain-containing protein [Bacteroidaceae bacterium]|nr:polyphosphate polymerase domain-containing protein [Bacteroidaceae bacterium]